MDHLVTDKHRVTVNNHLQRDPRLDGWTVDGIGSFSHSTEDWVQMILSIEIQGSLPAALREIYEHAQSCMVYGCYHYSLFTLGSEELFRFNESALRAAISEMGASAAVLKKNYAKLIDWAKDEALIDPDSANRWHAGRQLRNSTSHKSETMLLGPNDALWQLSITKELTEAVFHSCRSR